MTVSIDRTTSGGRAPSPPARLSVMSAPGGLDGLWWPRSRALARELPALTAALGDLWGRITGVTVNPAYWPVIPHGVSFAGRTVPVHSTTGEQDPHRVTLVCAGGSRDVLVIPPETGATAAARLMSDDGRRAPDVPRDPASARRDELLGTPPEDDLADSRVGDFRPGGPGCG